MLGQQLVQAGCLLQAAQLDQDGQHAAQTPGQGAGELAEQERLAAAEVAEHHHEPGGVVAEPVDDLLQQPVAGGGVLGVVDQPVPLVDVEPGRVDLVRSEPVGLPAGQRAQVEQALVVDEAAQPDPAPPGARDEVGGRGRSAVDQLGRHGRVGGG
jgi:hypothetical protein